MTAQTGMFDAGPAPKLRSVPPLSAAQWAAYAAWLAELEQLVGEERQRGCTIPSLQCWFSGWTPAQFVRHRLEPYEKVRQC